MTQQRDLRDPQKMGEAYLKVRALGLAIGDAVYMPCALYEDGGFISSNPADHHSKVDQTLGNLDDGGAS